MVFLELFLSFGVVGGGLDLLVFVGGGGADLIGASGELLFVGLGLFLG